MSYEMNKNRMLIFAEKSDNGKALAQLQNLNLVDKE